LNEIIVSLLAIVLQCNSVKCNETVIISKNETVQRSESPPPSLPGSAFPPIQLPVNINNASNSKRSESPPPANVTLPSPIQEERSSSYGSL
jgi:hypothetical protein